MLSTMQKQSRLNFNRGTHLIVNYEGTDIEGFFIKWQQKLNCPDQNLLYLSQDIESYKKYMKSCLRLNKITQNQLIQALNFKQYKKSCVRCLEDKKIVSINSKPFFS